MPDHRAGDFLAALLHDDQLPTALAGIAGSNGGDGAVLLYSRHNVPVRAVSSPALASRLDDYVKGDRPPDPRNTRVNPTLAEGFRFDHDDFSGRELARDPFYQEFLRPRGLGWHACALLSETPAGDTIHLSLKRAMDRGAFSTAELTPLTVILPTLRAAVQFTQASAGLLASETGGLRPMRGRSVLGFGSHWEAFVIDRTVEDAHVIALRNGGVYAADPNEQAALSAALERVRRHPAPAAVLLTGIDGERWCFRLQRWPAGTGVELSAVAVVSRLEYFEEPSADWMLLVRDLFHLSQAEARIAGLVGQGLTVPAIARRLALSPGTVRNQLKAVFAKVGVTRQTELSVLLSRL